MAECLPSLCANVEESQAMADDFDRPNRTVATPAELRAKALPTQPELTCVEVRFQVMYLVILMLCAHPAADTCGCLVLPNKQPVPMQSR